MKKILVALFGVVAGLAAQALDLAMMQVPDTFNPQKVEGEANTVAWPLPGGGSVKLQNETGGGGLSSPIPVQAVKAVEGFLEVFQKDKAIAAEVSGTTWFACALKEAEFEGRRYSFFSGPIVVKGYCFVLYLRTPANRGLDATVRAMLRQITLLPPDDGNSEPTIPLVKMDLAKVPPVDALPQWQDIAKAHKRVVEKASAPVADLSPLPPVVTAPKAPTVKPLVSDDVMNAATRKAAIAHVRESLRELVGPMSNEANAAFEKRWNAVMDYPAPEILAWLKKASPIISEEVRLKALIDAAMVACDDALYEAACAQAFGNAAAEREQMRAYAENLTAMKTAQTRMNALQKQLDALGEMPDPNVLRQTARTRRRVACAFVKATFGGAREKVAPVAPQTDSGAGDVYYVLDHVIMPDGKKYPDESAGVFSTSELTFVPETDNFRIDMTGYKREHDVWKKVKVNGVDRMVRSYFHKIMMVDFSGSVTCSPFAATGSAAYEVQARQADQDVDDRWTFKTVPLEKVSSSWTVGWALSRLVFPARKGEKLSVDFNANISGAPRHPNFHATTFQVSLNGTVGGELVVPSKARALVMAKKNSWKGSLTAELWRDPDHEEQRLNLDLCSTGVKDFGGGCRIGYVFRARHLEPQAVAACEAEVKRKFFPSLEQGKDISAAVDAVNEQIAVAEKEQVETDPPHTEQEKEEAIAFHRQNIAFIEGTIARLQAELAKETDEVRRARLAEQIVCERSDIIYEQDRIRAEKTGVFTASRTPWDEMCQIQQRENTLRQIQEAERLNRLYDLVDNLRSKQSLRERDATDKIVDRLLTEDPMNTAKWSQLANALWTKELGAREGAIAKADDAIARVDEREGYFRLGCDSAMLLLGGAGAPRVLMLAYQMEKGYIDDGVAGAAKGAVCFYSDAIDIAWSAYDGYKEGGLEGALKEGAKSYIMNKGMPYLMKKVNGLATKKTTVKTKVSADVKMYELEVKKAKGEISAYIKAQNAFNQADLSHMTDRQLTKLKSDLTVATARVNANPTAKACLKYDVAYKKVGAAFDNTLGRIHETIKAKFYADMEAKGFNHQEIMQFRNASSKGTVGMDADWGLKETPGMVITKNGKRVSVREWQREATESWNRVYKKSTGFDAQKSWENITTHAHSEAYRNMEILKYSKDANNMDEILSKLNASDAQQAFDVTRFKADEMLNGKDFSRLVYVREAARGTAKDMKSKLLPALDVKIKALQKTQAALTRQGKALSKNDAHNLARLEAAKAHYEAVMKTFDDIGTAKMSSEDWDDAIRTVTGGRGISEAINDMTDLFRSLVF